MCSYVEPGEVSSGPDVRVGQLRVDPRRYKAPPYYLLRLPHHLPRPARSGRARSPPGRRLEVASGVLKDAEVFAILGHALPHALLVLEVLLPATEVDARSAVFARAEDLGEPSRLTWAVDQQG